MVYHKFQGKPKEDCAVCGQSDVYYLHLSEDEDDIDPKCWSIVFGIPVGTEYVTISYSHGDKTIFLDGEIYFQSLKGNGLSIGHKMRKFRWHCGSLEDSMNSTVVINGTIDLLRIIRSRPHLADSELKDLKIEHERFDYRIGWDSHIVTIKGNVVGWTDGLPGDYDLDKSSSISQK